MTTSPIRPRGTQSTRRASQSYWAKREAPKNRGHLSLFIDLLGRLDRPRSLESRHPDHGRDAILAAALVEPVLAAHVGRQHQFRRLFEDRNDLFEALLVE